MESAHSLLLSAPSPSPSPSPVLLLLLLLSPPCLLARQPAPATEAWWARARAGRPPSRARAGVRKVFAAYPPASSGPTNLAATYRQRKTGIANGAWGTLLPSQRRIAVLCGEVPNAEPKPLPTRKLTREDVKVSFARSSGAGGQNVNKVNTKVDMRLDLIEADPEIIPEWVKEKLLEQEKNRINNNFELVVQSQKHRTQLSNIEDALSKMQAMIDKASWLPKEASEEQKKKMKALKKKAKEMRLDQKKKNSQKKADRRRPIRFD